MKGKEPKLSWEEELRKSHEENKARFKDKPLDYKTCKTWADIDTWMSINRQALVCKLEDLVAWCRMNKVPKKVRERMIYDMGRKHGSAAFAQLM